VGLGKDLHHGMDPRPHKEKDKSKCFKRLTIIVYFVVALLLNLILIIYNINPLKMSLDNNKQLDAPSPSQKSGTVAQIITERLLSTKVKCCLESYFIATSVKNY
jgi:hypothetical protein